MKGVHGNLCIRYLVNNEDDLLKVAKNAGGSLDNFTGTKPNRWEGPVGGVKTKIKWNQEGHYNTNDGPHVKIQKWIENGGG